MSDEIEQVEQESGEQRLVMDVTTDESMEESMGESMGESMEESMGGSMEELIEEAVEEGITVFGEAPVIPVIEAALMASGKAMTLEQLATLFDEDYRPDKPALKQAMIDLAEMCEGRGFELKEVASGWRFQVRKELAPWVGRLWDEKPQRYTRALLETLALVAYRQPITRGEIEDIRGVSVSTNIMRTLQEREWVRVVGHRDVPGRPAMYATTRQFLDYFNLRNLDELPPLSELRDLDAMAKQLESGLSTKADGQENLALDDNGEPLGAVAGEIDAAELVSIEEAQAFHEEGNQNIEKLFAELDGMEGELTLTYKDYNPQEESVPQESEPAKKRKTKAAKKAKSNEDESEQKPETIGDVAAFEKIVAESSDIGEAQVIDNLADDVDVENVVDDDDEDFELYKPTVIIPDEEDEDDRQDSISSIMDEIGSKRSDDDEID